MLKCFDTQLLSFHKLRKMLIENIWDSLLLQALALLFFQHPATLSSREWSGLFL